MPTILASLTLSRSNQYSHEGYDYPPNIRESFTDLGRSISDKVSLLSKASSPSEAGAAFTAPPSTKPQPKTFNHAIARASLAASQLLSETHPSGASEDPLATALEKLKQAGVWIHGAAATGGVAPWDADLTGPLCLVLGSEGGGLRPLIARTCDVLLTVPMLGQVGSLNVSAATAVICYEVVRQRHARRKLLDLTETRN